MCQRGARGTRLLPSHDPCEQILPQRAVPLIVIVLLVYLASQTLIPRKDAQDKVTYSEFIQQAEAGNVQEAKFTPTRNQIEATLVGGKKVKVNYPNDLSAFAVEQLLKKESIPYDSKGKGVVVEQPADLPASLRAPDRLDLPDEPGPGRRPEGDELRQVAKRMTPDSPKIGFKDVAGADEAVEELHEIKEFLEKPEEVPGARRPDPEGRPALRASRHRQDAVARRRRRGGRAVLLDLRLRLRRDVRRRRCLPRARPLRAGEAVEPHHLHG